jgi:hypothetical protein
MKNLKAFGIAVILFIIFVWMILIVTTKIVIPMKLDIGKSFTTPNVVELELSQAEKKLRDSGFVFQDSLAIEWVTTPNYPDRIVISQFPIAGKVVKNNSRIKLEVSTGGQQVVIPLVLEENAINASSKIKQLGLEVNFIKKKYGLYDQNVVVEVDPKVGSKVLKGSKVTLYIESEVEDLIIESDSLDVDNQEFHSVNERLDENILPIDDSTLEEILENN